MKRIFSLLLVVLLMFSIVACNNTTTETDTDTESPSTETAAADDDTQSDAADSQADSENEIGFFNADYDYSQNDTYEVVYMMYATSALNAAFMEGFQVWADRTNCELNEYSSNADNDAFITSLEVFAAQGIDGFILDPDTSIQSRVYDVCTENELNWISGMSPMMDYETGEYWGPCVGFDNYAFGGDMAEWLIDYAETTWGLTDFEKVGFISIDFSVTAQLHQRTTGAQDVWNGQFPDYADNFIIIDGASTGQLTSEASFNLVSATLSTYADMEYWLVAGCIDDYSDGAARAAEQAGKADCTVATTIGGTSLIAHWDAGEDSCWKSAIFTAQTLYSEPIFMGLYAIMNGDATPETLWPDWVDHSTNQTYASLLMPAFTLTIDNYQDYLEWVDLYTGVDAHPYEYQGGEYTARSEPPASYAG